MKKSGLFNFCLLTFLMMFSCANDTKISTFTTSYSDFTHSIMLEGVVEAVLSITLVSPRIFDGSIQFLVEDGEYVEEGQVVCIIENMEVLNQYEQVLIQLEDAEAGLTKTKADLNMQFALLEAQVRTNEADTKIALMDSLQITYMSPVQRAIKGLELEKATIEKTRYEKKLEALKIIQQSEIKKLELEIHRLRSKLQTNKEQIDALTLKAPRNGMIIRSHSILTGEKYQVGDIIWSNMIVATLPEFKEMKIKIMATEADFKNINVNDSVSFTFDAMPGNFGTGKIIKKSPIGQPYKRGKKVKFFEIEASVDSVLAMPEPGFTVNCRIITKQVENVIYIPQIAIFEEDSMKVVYVQLKKGYEKRQILTDVTSPKEAVITVGLAEGEVISLSKPNPKLVKDLVTLPDSLTVNPETPDNFSIPENSENPPLTPNS